MPAILHKKLNKRDIYILMRICKFILLWIILTAVMLVTWSIGFLVGNGITQSIPPSVDNPTSAALSFFIVCFVNSLLLSALVWSTRAYSGAIKGTALILYTFVIQFFLTQLETFFFSESIDIGKGQIASILIAGLVMSLTTVTLGILIANKMNPTDLKATFKIEIFQWRYLMPALILLACIVYPSIYLFFGYYIAWQSESLRIFYSQSAELNPFFIQWVNALSNGVYIFQILRGTIWVVFSIPIVLMLQHSSLTQYLLIGFLSALLPTTQLFIPNPYMPPDIAITHFMETSVSNFLWGIIVTLGVNKYIRTGSLKIRTSF